MLNGRDEVIGNTMRLSQILAGLGATVRRDGEVTSFGSLNSTRPNTLHYYFDERFSKDLRALSGVHSVVATSELADQVPSAFGVAVASNPKEVFLLAYLRHAAKLMAPSAFPTEIDPSASVHPRAWVAERSVRIGPGVVIDANAVIKERVDLEEGAYVGPGSVIGGSGCEYGTVRGRQILVPHHGGVVVGSGVNILANCCVACGQYGDNTIVGRDTILDNLVHVAHNVSLGERCQVLASAMIAGACIIGDDVRIGPHATVSNALRIGRGARVTLGAVVTRDVPEGGHVTGHFAIPHARFLDNLRSTR